MTRYLRIFIFYILITLYGLPPSYSFENDDAWFSLQKLQVAYGRWSPDKNISIEMGSNNSQNFFLISGNPDEILFKLDEKRIELDFLFSEIVKLEQCKTNSCTIAVNNSSGNLELTTLDSERLEVAITNLKSNFDQLRKFIEYAEVKLIDYLPNLLLFLEFESFDEQNNSVSTIEEIRNLVNSRNDLKIISSELFIKVTFNETWSNHNDFEFIGTVSQVIETMTRSKAAVADRYETLTGIKVLFSENGNGITWDSSSARLPLGITENTPRDVYEAYVNIKELTIANAEVTRQIIDAALLKPPESRSELEKKTIDAALRESINALITFTRQDEMRRLSSQEILNREGEMLSDELSGIYSTLEVAAEKQLPQDFVQKLQERAEYIKSYVANLEKGILEGDIASRVSAEAFIDEILKLSPEESARLIEESIVQAKTDAETLTKELVATMNNEIIEK